MSTYNGQEYIKQQILSIFEQSIKPACVLIRDDGSTDETVSVLSNLAKIYAELEVIEGQNLGSARSFLEALRAAPEGMEYYAFADQDDVWLPDKIESAISILERSDSEMRLYASSVLMTDEDLRTIGENTYERYIFNLGSIITRGRLAGHTMVFSAGLRRSVIDLMSNLKGEIYSHDQVVLTICCALQGAFCLETQSHVLHRRLGSSQTAGGNGMLKRLFTEMKLVVFNRDRHREGLAMALLETETLKLSDEQRDLCRQIIDYRASLRSRIALALSREINCGLTICNLEARLAVLFGNY